MRGCGEARALENSEPKLANGDPIFWVASKDHAKDVVQLIRQRENCLQETWVPGESFICGILRRCLFPWITATCKIDKDNTKGPNVVGCTSV
jgi:hypothetical protein